MSFGPSNVTFSPHPSCQHRSFVQVVFAYHCDAKNFSEFSREEFTQGCEAKGYTTLESLKAGLPELRKSLNEPTLFEGVYNHTFPWACEPGKKIMQARTPSPCRLCEHFCRRAYQHYHVVARGGSGQ